jgi:hypothetical protein
MLIELKRLRLTTCDMCLFPTIPHTRRLRPQTRRDPIFNTIIRILFLDFHRSQLSWKNQSLFQDFAHLVLWPRNPSPKTTQPAVDGLFLEMISPET